MSQENHWSRIIETSKQNKNTVLAHGIGQLVTSLSSHAQFFFKGGGRFREAELLGYGAKFQGKGMLIKGMLTVCESEYSRALLSGFGPALEHVKS